ncbi:MAG: SGNH/GDSL hydrolase family protein [Cytophagaceae bacterium]
MPHSLSILALGDSYTIGDGLPVEEAYPSVLAGLLKEKHQISVNVKIVARTGWTSGELLENLLEYPIPDTYDFVYLLIGVNNQYRNLSPEAFREDLEKLFSLAHTYLVNSDDPLIVLSIPDWGQTPFGRQSGRSDISEEIKLFNFIIEEQCKAEKEIFVDITELTVLFEQKEPYLNPDLLHPGSIIYKSWANKVLNYTKLR